MVIQPARMDKHKLSSGVVYDDKMGVYDNMGVQWDFTHKIWNDRKWRVNGRNYDQRKYRYPGFGQAGPWESHNNSSSWQMSHEWGIWTSASNGCSVKPLPKYHSYCTSHNRNTTVANQFGDVHPRWLWNNIVEPWELIGWFKTTIWVQHVCRCSHKSHGSSLIFAIKVAITRLGVYASLDKPRC